MSIYLGTLIFSIVILLVFIGRAEGMLFLRKELRNKEPKEERKKMYKHSLIVWAIATIAFFLYVKFNA